MRSSRQGAIPSDLGWLVDELDALSERLRTLEAPSGESLGSTVAKLQALVANIQAQLDAWVAGRWTNAQIDARIAAPPFSVSVAGNISTSGFLFTPSTQSTAPVAGMPPVATMIGIRVASATAAWKTVRTTARQG
jgi:hypothetical protein